MRPKIAQGLVNVSGLCHNGYITKGKTMGNAFASELATEDFGLTLEQAIGIHFSSNHYPPIPATMIPVAIEAIDLANQGEWEAPVRLPEGVYYRDKESAPVWAIVDQHNLHNWIEED